MADDFQVQQTSSQSSSLGYGLTGAVLGGGGTYWALNKFTKPKYGSYEEILLESKDSFDKKVASAPEADKKFLTSAEEIRNIISSAGDKFDKRKAEYIKLNAKLSEKEAEELVCSEYSVKSRVEFINNNVKEKSESLLKEFGENFNRKWGFEGNTKFKLAGVALAGAVVLGGIFSALSPKKNV